MFYFCSVASFDKLPAQNGSVDLVNVSEAVHWFIPIENFYKEVDRVLKPGGCLFVYEYGHAEYVNHPHAEELTKSIYEVNPKYLQDDYIFSCEVL